MKVIHEKTYEDLSRTASNIVMAKMYQNRRVNLALTAGSSPKGVYELMIPQMQGRDYLDNVYFYNFDEIPLKGKDLGITLRDMKNLLYDPAGVSDNHIVRLDEHTYPTQMQRIRDAGGLDLMLMGLGWDGHYCGNLPGTTKFADEIVTVSNEAVPGLAERIAKNHHINATDLTDYYITMGPKAVMETKELLLIINGKHKAEATRRLFNDPISEEFPATLLRLHPNFTVILDDDAASLL